MLLPLAAFSTLLPAAFAEEEATAPVETAPVANEPSDDDAAAQADADEPRRRGGKGARPGRPGRPDKGPPDNDDDRRPRPWMHIRPVGLLQVWATAYDWDQDTTADSTGYGDPEDDPGFKIKRFRLGLAGNEDHLSWTFAVGLTAPYDGYDDENGDLEIIDAHVAYEAGGFGVEVGRGELPFGRDEIVASAEQTFQERGMIAEHITPNRDIGASVFAERWGLKLTLGAYNSGGDIFGDDNLGKTFLGRLEFGHGPANLYETWGGPKALSFGLGVGGFLTDDVATSTKAVGADGILRVAGLTVMVDAALASVSPTDTLTDTPEVWEETTRRGLTGQLGYGIGPVEIAAKTSLYEDSAIGGYTTILGGVVYHGLLDDRDRDRVRVGLGYEARLEEAAIPNDTIRIWVQARP